MKAISIKKLSRKSLSVFLAVLMLMSSMSVCFSTVAFAAGGTPTDAQWTALANALNNDSVKNAQWPRQNQNDYLVEDSDGLVAAAVAEYFNVFNTLANTAPTSGDPSKTSNITGSTEGNRTINQINESIKTGVAGKLSTADYNAVKPFLEKLVAGVSVSSGTGSEQSSGRSTSDNKTVPATNLAAVADIKVTVKLGNALGETTLDNLPPSIDTEITYTIKHANNKYDYTYKKETVTEGSGCDAKDVTYYTRTYKYFYYVSAQVTGVEGATMDTSVLTNARDTLATYADYFSMSIDELIAKGATDIGAVKTAINNVKKTVVDSFGANVWNKLFKDTYDVDALTSLINDAADVIAVKPTTDALMERIAQSFDDIYTDEAALNSLYGTLTGGLAAYDKTTAGAKAYLTEHGFDRAAVKAYADDVFEAIQLCELRRLKIAIDNDIAVFGSLTEDDVIYTPITGETLALYKGTVNGYLTALNSYPAALVAQVMTDDEAEKLEALAPHFADLVYVAGYNDEFSAEYAKYVAEIYLATKPDASSSDLLGALKGNAEEGIQGYDAWYTGLKNLLTRIEANLPEGTAEKILAEKDDAMKDRMEATYEALHAKVLAQIDNAIACYNAVSAIYGTTVTLSNVGVYASYLVAYDSIDVDSYNYLKSEAANYKLPQSTIDKYNSLVANFGKDKWDEFIATGGFSMYQKQVPEYVDRPVLENDLIKDSAYDVNSETAAKIIEALDKLITSDEVSALLGGLLNEDGSSLDIAKLIKDLIGDMLFSDALINTLIQTLYPLLLGELVKVWANDLPTEVDVVGKVTYDKNLWTVANDLGIALYPDQMAAKLDSTKYAENKAMLNAAVANFNSEFPGAKSSTDYFTTEPDEDGKLVPKNTAWDSSAICNEDGTLKLTWGVDAVKEAGADFDTVANTFYQAFDDAFEGLKKVLYALFCNKTVDASSDKVAHVSFLGTKYAALNITVNGLPGFANILVPIYDMLGVSHTPVSTIQNTYPNNTNGVADLLKAIIDPLLTFIDQLAAQPLDTVIALLPNLCYALLMQSLPKLLGLISVNIHYAASVSIGCDIDAASDDIAFNVGEMFDINSLIDLRGGVGSLLAMLGVDIPALDDAKLAQMGDLVQINTQRAEATYTGLASGKAYHINADKGAVMYYLLQYIFDIVGNDEQFAGLLGMLMTKDVEVLDGAGNPTYDENGNVVMEAVPDEEKINGVITAIKDYGLFAYGTDYAIAAIVELFAPVEYEMAEADWVESQYDYESISGATGATITYLDYSNDWTKEKATYLVDNIDTILPAVLTMAGMEETDINALISDMINGLFTNDTLTGLISAIADLGTALAVGPELEGLLDSALADFGADLTLISDAFGYLFVTEEDMAAEDFVAPLAPDAEGYRNTTAVTGEKTIVTDENGVEAAAYAWYYNGELFADGDRDMFINIVVETLGGLTPVLMKIFKGEDLSILGALNIETYNGYANSIGLLFEALGIEAISQAEFNALSANDALAYIVNTLFGKLDAILEGSPVKNILELLPNLIYFIESNGISVVLQNLLLPILALLDTVRPIFDLNVNGILSTIVSELVSFGNLDAINLMDVILGKTVVHEEDGYEWIAIDIRHLTITDILAIVDAALGTNLIGSELGIYGIPGFCSGIEEYASVVDSGVAKRTTVDAADAITILVTALIEALDTEVEGTDGLTNLDVIFGMIEGGEETAEIVKNVLDIIDGFKFEYELPNWLYMAAGQDLTTFAPRPSITYLAYATDWTPEVAQSVYGVLDEVVDMLLPSLLGEAESIAALIEGILADNVYNDDIFNMIVETIVNLFTGIDKALFEHIDVILDTNIFNTWLSDDFVAFDEETGKYVCVKEWNVTDRASFQAALEAVLAPVDKLLAFVFFGDGLEFFTGTEMDAEGNFTHNDIINVEGIEGYDYAIVPILEALGLELPTAEDLEYKTSAAVNAILDQLFNLIDRLTTSESTVEVVFELLPNLIYFINADGLKNSVNNLLNAADQIIAAVGPMAGLEETSVKDLIGEIKVGEAVLDITDLSMDALLGIAGAYGVNISPDMLAIIKDLYVGQFVEYTSANGFTAYKLDATSMDAKGDVLTIVLSIAVDLFNLNKDLFADLLGGEDIYNAIYNLIRGAKEQFVYVEPNWGYMYEGGTAELAANGGHMPKYPENTTAANYLLYQNNWNKKTAEYVNTVIDAVIEGIMGETSLGQMLDNAITNGFYKDDILNSLLSMIVGLIYDYADIIEGAGALIGASKESVKMWFDYCTVDENGNVVVTHDFGVDEAATNDEKREIFVNAFVEVLEPAYGLLAWLLFDQDLTFFNGTTNETLITITGGRGYEEALVPLFEAVGAKMPDLEDKMYENGETAMKPASAYVTADGVDMATFVFDIFSALTGWLSQICGDLANPGEYGVIGAMLDLLPNIIYNINAGTVKAVVQNLLLPVEEVLSHLEAFGLTVDFSSLIEIRGAALDLKNLDWYAVFDIVEVLRLYWPDNIQDFLATLYLGEAVEFTSANGKTAYYVTYNTDTAAADADYLVYGREDMITHVISFVIDAVLDKRNEDRLYGWLGSYYTVIYNYLAGNVVTIPMQEMDWQLTDKVGEVVTPAVLGATINGNEGFYGELYTREMAEYIEKWLPSFVDTMIVLLGVQGEDGENYEGLNDLISGFVGSSLYTTDNLNAILGLIQGLIPTLEDAVGTELFNVIADVLVEALNVDLRYWNDYTVNEIATGDREAFVTELTNMFVPAYPILRWLLTGEDLIALFYTHEGRDALVVEGAEGYAYGIIPLLEAFDYQGNILTPDEFAALEDAPAMLEAILNPVLDVVDQILTDPANEIFNVLPGVLYFLNSNGLDTVIKNTANAIFAVLENLEPAIGELDVYELLGFNAAEMNVETLFNMLLGSLEEKYGVELTDPALSALNELTVGTLVEFTSKNGETAYTVEYASGADRVDMVTLVLRTVLTFITIPENVAGIDAILAENLDGEGYKFASALLENFSNMAKHEGGMDEIMFTVYQIFYAANVAAHSTEDWLGEFNDDYSFLNQLFKTSDLDFLKQIEISLGDLLNNYTGDIIDDDEIAPNGLIAFFQKIADFFKKIAEFFQNLFK